MAHSEAQNRSMSWQERVHRGTAYLVLVNIEFLSTRVFPCACVSICNLQSAGRRVPTIEHESTKSRKLPEAGWYCFTIRIAVLVSRFAAAGFGRTFTVVDSPKVFSIWSSAQNTGGAEVFLGG